jgi:hypothetical protein
MENAGITLWFAENKGDKNWHSSNGPRPLNVTENKPVIADRPKCY